MRCVASHEKEHSTILLIFFAFAQKDRDRSMARNEIHYDQKGRILRAGMLWGGILTILVGIAFGVLSSVNVIHMFLHMGEESETAWAILTATGIIVLLFMAAVIAVVACSVLLVAFGINDIKMSRLPDLQFRRARVTSYVVGATVIEAFICLLSLGLSLVIFLIVLIGSVTSFVLKLSTVIRFSNRRKNGDVPLDPSPRDEKDLLATGMNVNWRAIKNDKRKDK